MAKINTTFHLNTYQATWVVNVCQATHTGFTFLQTERKEELSNKILLQPLVFAFFTRGHEWSRSKQRGNYCDSVIVCVVSQQGRVQRDFWERRGAGRVLGPAKQTETVAASASVCVTASVVSAVWLQVTICMHVCPQLSL